MTWYAKRTGAYYMGSTEADGNANEALLIMMTEYGWTYAACCGVFGNIDYEGQWNPWRWESDNVRSVAQSQSDHGWTHGYGLIGWTPSGKYIWNNFTMNGVVLFPNYNQESYPGYGPNFSDRAGLATDGAAQIRLICEAMSRGSGNIWVKRKNCTASQFIHLTDPKQAAYYWLWNAEYPANPSAQENNRMTHAQRWYDHLGGGPSVTGTPLPIIFKKIADRSRGFL